MPYTIMHGMRTFYGVYMYRWCDLERHKFEHYCQISFVFVFVEVLRVTTEMYLIFAWIRIYLYLALFIIEIYMIIILFSYLEQLHTDFRYRSLMGNVREA